MMDLLVCCRGCFLNYYPIVIPFHPTYQIENAINYGYGSFCFLMSGLLMYIQVTISAHVPYMSSTALLPP